MNADNNNLSFVSLRMQTVIGWAWDVRIIALWLYDTKMAFRLDDVCTVVKHFAMQLLAPLATADSMSIRCDQKTNKYTRRRRRQNESNMCALRITEVDVNSRVYSNNNGCEISWVYLEFDFVVVFVVGIRVAFTQHESFPSVRHGGRLKYVCASVCVCV